MEIQAIAKPKLALLGGRVRAQCRDQLKIVKSGVGHVDINAVTMRTRVHTILVEKSFQYFDQRIIDSQIAPFLKMEEWLDCVSTGVKHPSRGVASEITELGTVASSEFGMIVRVRLNPVSVTEAISDRLEQECEALDDHRPVLIQVPVHTIAQACRPDLVIHVLHRLTQHFEEIEPVFRRCPRGATLCRVFGLAGVYDRLEFGISPIPGLCCSPAAGIGSSE